MSIFRIVLLAGLAFLGAVALFLGAMVVLTSLQNGAISWTYSINGSGMAETVTRAADAGRFWKLFAQLGLAPMLLGLAALWYGVRRLKRG